MFKKYNSIENTYRKKEVDRALFTNTDNLWVVSEKIHGSNISILEVDGKIRIAKRTSLLGEEANFFNIHDYKHQLITIYNTIKKYIDLPNMQVYGEYFGGLYPHDDIKVNKDAQKIQKGVYYSPDNHFYIFDITYMENEIIKYLDYKDFEKVMEQVEKDITDFKFFWSKALFIGTLQEALEYPNNEITRIPELLGLPPIEDNLSEGVVIKLANGRLRKGLPFTTMFKNKNDKFKEKQKKGKKHKKPIELSENAITLLETMTSYITEHRLECVMSKMGEVKLCDFGKVLRYTYQDIIDELKKDELMYLFKEIDKKEKNVINKTVNSKVANILKTII